MIQFKLLLNSSPDLNRALKKEIMVGVIDCFCANIHANHFPSAPGAPRHLFLAFKEINLLKLRPARCMKAAFFSHFAGFIEGCTDTKICGLVLADSDSEKQRGTNGMSH